MNEVVFSVVEDKGNFVVLKIDELENLTHSLLERLQDILRETLLWPQHVADPSSFLSQACLHVFRCELDLLEGSPGQLQSLGNVGLADNVVFIRKHALLQLRWLENIFELEFTAFASLLILFSLLHLQRPVVICAITKGSPVVFLSAFVQTGGLQSFRDQVYAWLRDVAVVFDLVFELVVLDEVIKFVA